MFGIGEYFVYTVLESAAAWLYGNRRGAPTYLEGSADLLEMLWGESVSAAEELVEVGGAGESAFVGDRGDGSKAGAHQFFGAVETQVVEEACEGDVAVSAQESAEGRFVHAHMAGYLIEGYVTRQIAFSVNFYIFQSSFYRRESLDRARSAAFLHIRHYREKPEK